MNVFIVGSPFETAQALDRRRLNKQIIECHQVLFALDGTSKAWAKHPVTLSYKEDVGWLITYTWCLIHFKEGRIDDAKQYSELAQLLRPAFHTQEYFDQMKRRLYTKDSEHYAQWAHLGTSEVNWYYVDGEWRYYKDGKRI